ncbi:acetyl xylan esterase [Violaceomyces palustris]|uniref:Acetyl xylan esterase n=1 Tax=Violaceomyces palustris TaxID=1673888 RepID=A0ACD0P490_9BASI|nr:acetyl xylan esterase [Violaceomyces palustris]
MKPNLSFLLAAIASLPMLAFSRVLERRYSSTLEPVPGFSPNPTNVPMYLYKPTSFKAGNPVILVVHYCGGSAQAMFGNLPDLPTLADERGILLIYPDSPHLEDHCWDVSSKETLTHDGGGDSTSLKNMVDYAQATYKASEELVYVMGISSGAMMTQVLSATYPNVFRAAAAYSGVPAGCFASPTGLVDAWNPDCAQGKIIKTAKEWGDIARAMYPQYSSRRPRMQLFHGTADDVLLYQDHLEAVKQWSDVLQVDLETPTSVRDNWPSQGLTTTEYGNELVRVVGNGIGHNFPANMTLTLDFFGIL